MHKVLDKADDREEVNSISSKGSTNLSFSKPSPPPPTIRVIGFRNFVPAFDVKITEEEAKSVRESRDFKDIKLDDSPLVIKLDKKFEDAGHTPVIEAFEAGPFFVFTYSESVRNGHFKTIQSLESIKVSFSHKENSAGADLLLGEEDLFLLEVEENECVYIVPKEHFAQKMKLYAVPEEFSNNFAVETLRDKISSIDFSIHRRIQLNDDELIRLGIVSKGIFGECYRIFHKENKRYYGISEVTLKSPEVLSLVLQQIDVLSKISHSNYPELSSIVSLQVLQQQEEFEPVKLRIISNLGLGSLEEFSAYKSHIKEDWKEEELLKLIVELLRQYKVFKELKMSIRDIRPSNVVFCKESKSLRFLDLSLACIFEQDSDMNELAGIPKNLPLEVTNNLDQIITTNHNTFLADLYSIGITIADLVGVQNGNISYRRLLVEGKIREIMREKYPILWERFLCKLLEPEPINRKEAIQNVKLTKEELAFIANSDKDFETFITEKEFATKEELITDYKTFLSYFWDLGSFSLIDKMDTEILEKFKTTGDSLRKVTRFSQKIADLYESKGMLDKAASVYERLASILEDEGNVKEDEQAENKENNHPDQDQENHFLLELYSKIGSIHKSQKNYNKALEYYEKALYFEYLKDPEDMVYDFKNHMEIAEVYEELGHCDLALETYTKIQERFKQSYKNRANQLQEGLLYERIAGLYFRRNEFLAAVEEAERAIQSYTTCYGKHHVSVGNCEKLLGDIFKKIGDLTEAMKHYEIYFANSFNGSNKQDAGFLKLMEEMSDYYKNRGQYNEAIENYQRAINLSIYQDDENSLCVLYQKLAECYNLQKRYILAVKTLRLCYKLKASNLGENSLELVPIIEKIAANYIQDGEQNEALKEFSRALSIVMLYKSNDDPMVTEILTKIGKISPLAFLAYKNYKRSSTVGSISSRGNINKTNIPILISFNKVEDVRGVLGGIDFNVSLYELRELISKECTYLGFFKYNFLREGEVVDILGEKLVKLEECIIKKDGFNHLVIEEGKNIVRQRMTY